MAYMWCFLKKRYTNRVTLAICACCTVGVMLLDYLMIFAFSMSEASLVIGSALETVLVQSTAQLIAKNRGSATLFVGLSAANYVLLGNLSAMCVGSFLENRLPAVFVQVLINGLVLFWTRKRIRTIYAAAVRSDIGIWLKLCLIPMFYYITFFLLTLYPANIYEKKENFPGAIALLVTMIFSYIILLRNVYMSMMMAREANRRSLMRAFSRHLAEDLEMLHTKEQRIRVLNHDMKHLAIVLKELINQENYDEVKRLLDERLDDVETDAYAIYCENPFVNNILYYMSRRKNGNVTLHVKAAIPKELAVDSMELAVVISNLLENAMEAAELQNRYEKEVYFLAQCDNGRLILEIKNPYEGIIEYDPDSGLPLSQRGKDHGFGMLSIDTFVKKYHAEFDCYEKDGMFVVHLLVGV